MILMIAIPDISSTNGASIGINFFSPGFTITCSLGNIGIDLLKNLKHDSQESITPFNSNRCFSPNTMSTLSNISNTNVNTYNPWPQISIITSITNKTPTY